MADRMAAEIWIGGAIPESLIDILCERIRDAGVSLDYGQAPFKPYTAQELLEAAAEHDGLLRLCDSEVAWGEFEDLEACLFENDIPYTRKSDGKYEHDPVVVEFRPESGLHECTANKAMQPVVEVESLTQAVQTLDEAMKLLRDNHSLVAGVQATEKALRMLREQLPPRLPPLKSLEIVVPEGG